MVELGDQDSAEDKSFEQKLTEAIETHFDDFESGSVYHKMRDIFDSKIAEEGLKRSNKAKLGAKRIGVAFNTFRKMLSKLRGK